MQPLGAVVLPNNGKTDALTSASIRFEDLATMLQSHHPRLKAASEKINAAAGRAEQASLLPNPSAEIGVEEFGFHGGGASGAQPMLRIRQPIRRGAERQAAVAAAQSEIETARRQLEELRIQLMGELNEVHADILFHRQALALNDDLTSLSRRSLEIARTRFELQASPQSDVSRAEVEIFDLEMARREIVRDQAQSAIRLTELLGGIEVQSERITGDFAPSITTLSTQSLRNWIIEHHPSLAAARTEEQASFNRVRLATQEGLADLEVSAGVSHHLADGENTGEFAIGFELPLFDRNQGRIAESEAELRSARHSIQAVAQQLLAELATAVSDWTAAHDRLVYHTNHVLPSARQALDQVREGYLAGKLDFLELMDSQRTLVTARLQQLELKHELIQAEARLYRLAGPAFTTLEGQSRSLAPQGELP